MAAQAARDAHHSRDLLLGGEDTVNPTATSTLNSEPVGGENRLSLVISAAAAKYAGKGPQTGIFTDGSCERNPGPGGWAAVGVRAGSVEWSATGRSKDTTNNRMELRAIIEALERAPANEPVEVRVFTREEKACGSIAKNRVSIPPIAGI